MIFAKQLEKETRKMPKEFIDYKLNKSFYNLFDCYECDAKADYRLGVRSPDGIGYNVKALCKKCYDKAKNKLSGVKK